MLDSIGAIAIVRYIVGVRSWEGPLWEVPLYLCAAEILRVRVFPMEMCIQLTQEIQFFTIFMTIMHNAMQACNYFLACVLLE